MSMSTSSSKPKSTTKAAKPAVAKTSKTSVAKSRGKIDLLKPLQEYFGLDSFRGDQEEIIQTLLSGTDTFVINAHRWRKKPLLPVAGHD